MALATVYTRGSLSVSAPLVTVEVHAGRGLPALLIVGLIETAVRESRERVRAAIAESGFEFPDHRVTVSLAPAELPKAGGRFDLAIAIGILVASRQLPHEALGDYEFFGELGLDGRLRPTHSLLPGLVATETAGRRAVVPAACNREAALLKNSPALLAGHLLEVVGLLRNETTLPAAVSVPGCESNECAADLKEVRGQHRARRALEIAAAGGHNLLLVGPPGTGKTMLASRLPGVLPALSDAEAIDVAMLQSLRAEVPDRLSHVPPFRAPHHSASTAAVVGGCSPPVPGEVSLAHHGVLFLDELPEFSRPALEALREPLESECITVARAAHRAVFPARVQLVAAMNPCPCGFAGDPVHACSCSPAQLRRYGTRISGPLLDRMDLAVALSREPPATGPTREGHASEPESSAAVRDRVAAARAYQHRRQGFANRALGGRDLARHCRLDSAGQELLNSAANKLALSARGCDRALRVARSIADLAGEATVANDHLAEALGYRPPAGLRQERV